MSNVNWPIVFAKQKPLSKHIEEKHPIKEGEDRVKQKCFALMTELAECANEWKGFKFWKVKRIANHEEMLEELADIIHFVADIGLEIGVKDYQIQKVDENTLGLFAAGMYLSYMVGYSKFHLFDNLISVVDELVVSLGFTKEEIMNAYHRKNQINFERQANSY